MIKPRLRLTDREFSNGVVFEQILNPANGEQIGLSIIITEINGKQTVRVIGDEKMLIQLQQTYHMPRHLSGVNTSHPLGQIMEMAGNIFYGSTLKDEVPYIFETEPMPNRDLIPFSKDENIVLGLALTTKEKGWQCKVVRDEGILFTPTTTVLTQADSVSREVANI
jgi:hypothetical protein